MLFVLHAFMSGFPDSQLVSSNVSKLYISNSVLNVFFYEGPVDRQNITPPQLRPVPRILRNLLYRWTVWKVLKWDQKEMIPWLLHHFSRLQLTCDNSVYGCTAILKLDALDSHVQECEFNPKRPVPCELGCGLVVPKDELKVSGLSPYYMFVF
jgi:hypothetical protein